MSTNNMMNYKTDEENLALYHTELKEYPEIEYTYHIDGYKVSIMRSREGTNNGYVHLPSGHHFYNWNYYLLDKIFKIHGGITFTGLREDDWLIGFDTSNLGDSCPLRSNRIRGHYWTHAEVLTELNKLVGQIVYKVSKLAKADYDAEQ